MVAATSCRQTAVVRIKVLDPGLVSDLAAFLRAAEFAVIGVHRLVLLAPPDPDGSARTIEAGTAAVARLR